MSNYLGRRSEFTPSVYTRYFEQTESRKSPSCHIYFNDNKEDLSSNYQTKRDHLFKRLFPSKYADENTNNTTPMEQISHNGDNHSSNNTTESLGDYISLSNGDSSTQKKRSASPQSDVILASSDDNDDDLLIEDRLPSSTHESIVGHVHPHSTIENVRAILIRELYQRTSDPHTEWLKCKMEISRNYINPKYYADFQRRYRKEIQRNTLKKKKSNSNKNTTDKYYPVLDLSTSQVEQTDEIIETFSVVSTNKPPELIVLDSDGDEDINQATQSKYFIDRSSTLRAAISEPPSTSNEDYREEDSKYAQLPTRNTSSPAIIRPILSKNQRRKKVHSAESPKPLVVAIDRIIDQMDQAHTLNTSKTIEQQNLLVKEIKKRKKKKKKKKMKLLEPPN